MDVEAAVAELRTVGDLIRWGASAFNAAGLHFGHGTDNAADEARQLVFFALSLDPQVPAYFYETRVLERERRAALDLLARRVSERRPAAYLTGEAWLGGLAFHVDERVLVPRSPLVELIERGFSPWAEPQRIHRVLDMCTGSGCLAIACALHLPDVHVDAADLSPGALEVAAANVERYGLADRVNLVTSDLFAALGGRRYDVIVCNPPYVDAREMERLPAEYRHEPAPALAAGEDGLDFVRRLLDEAAAHLEPEGLLVVEVGASAAALGAARPELPLTWVDLERGGEGVFVIGARELAAPRRRQADVG